MSTAGQALEADHRVIDDHFAAFATAAGRGAVERDRLAAALRALRLHIWVEEELFFPPLRAAGLLGPVLVMLREHGEIWRLLGELETIVAAEAPDLPAALAVWESLAEVLRQHNMKEERILYAAADQILDDGTAAEVTDGLAEALPDGWVCGMAAAR